MRWYSILTLVLPALLLVGCGSNTRQGLADDAIAEITAMSSALHELKDDAGFQSVLEQFNNNVTYFADLAKRSKPMPPMTSSGAKKLSKEIENVERNLSAQIDSPNEYLKANADKHKQLKEAYTKMQASLEIMKRGN